MKLNFDLQSYLVQQERIKKGYVEEYDDPDLYERENELQKAHLNQLDLVTIDKITISIPKRILNIEKANKLFDPKRIVVLVKKKGHFIICFNAEFFNPMTPNYAYSIKRFLSNLLSDQIIVEEKVLRHYSDQVKNGDMWPVLERIINVMEIEVAFDCPIECLVMPKNPKVMLHPYLDTWYSNDLYEYEKDDGSTYRRSKSTISIYRRDLALKKSNKTKHNKLTPTYRLEFRIHDLKCKSLSWKTLENNKIRILQLLEHYMTSCGSKLLDPEILISDENLANTNYPLYMLLVCIKYKQLRLYYDFLTIALKTFFFASSK